ncbi:hypothetical protein H0E87_025977 [Populus deltoides]|uniref:Zinc knuckle CX2CX4HX4C domain-containing protein n=1 Tax=Populus deltoides TaxID=3696 RepID=A0A8T2X5C9_POPDE|nr:hypothetical protein H0E87_025977 [Populus deltoides]
MSRLSHARVLIEINLATDQPSSIPALLPNGSTLQQTVVFETLPRFCKQCKVLSHSTATCPSTRSQQGNAEMESNKRGYASTNNPVEVTKGSLPSAEQISDPMQAEFHATTEGWEVVRGKNRKPPRTQAQIVAPQPSSRKGKEVAGPEDSKAVFMVPHSSQFSSGAGSACVGLAARVIDATGGAACEGSLTRIPANDGGTTDLGLNSSKGKEPVKAPPSRKEPEGVIAGATTIRGHKRNISRSSRSGRVPPTFS